MKKKTNLSICPACSVNKPCSYRPWQGPNLLEQPYTLPYPFIQKALNWVAAGMLFGVLFLTTGTETVAALPTPNNALVMGDSLKKPFTWEKMGLPFYTSPCGYGSPLRITEHEARLVIDSVFRSEGLKLEKTKVKTKNGYVEVTGMDNDHKIGYVWLG